MLEAPIKPSKRDEAEAEEVLQRFALRALEKASAEMLARSGDGRGHDDTS